ncbi:MAG: hypothetical protein HYX69_18240 [Planctomycetia bacterium]|nr:hypothetical protein [Planctomycetia bacterium]
MKLMMDSSIAANYKSRPQIARVISEQWCAGALYCAACTEDNFRRTSANTQAVDSFAPGATATIR